MTAEQLLSAFYPAEDKEKVLSLLPVVRDPAGIRDSINWSLLHWAAGRGWTDVCRLLVEQYQVDPHCRDSSGRTALYYASEFNHLDTVQYLVTSVCCDPLTENKLGLTKSNRGLTPFSVSIGETELFLKGIIG